MKESSIAHSWGTCVPAVETDERLTTGENLVSVQGPWCAHPRGTAGQPPAGPWNVHPARSPPFQVACSTKRKAAKQMRTVSFFELMCC